VQGEILFAWDAWVFVFWQGLGERWRRIDGDMRCLIDEGWREKRPLFLVTCGGS